MRCFLIFLIIDVVNGGISIFGCIQPGEVAKLRRIFQQKNQGGCPDCPYHRPPPPHVPKFPRKNNGTLMEH
jgi:hypothetical protein